MHIVKCIPNFVFILATPLLSITGMPDIDYLHPLPESKYVSPSTTIIVLPHESQKPFHTKNFQFRVTGNESGLYSGETILSSDERTFIFKPRSRFTPGEKVTVTLKSKLMSDDFTFTFTVSSSSLNEISDSNLPDISLAKHYDRTRQTKVRVINGVSVPSDLALFRPEISTAPSDGLLFIATWNSYMIVRNDGSPYFYRQSNSHVWDFTVHSDSIISVIDGATAKTMGKDFELRQKYNCQHGYTTNPHEFQVLANGHVLLIAEDRQKVDMSKIVEGGKPNATVVGSHVQELDANKNVVFEWRCWDHYNIVDALHENLQSNLIHAVHMNSIDVDYDGHLVVSSRRLDEVTKINRNTGEIIWRLGGNNNQFEFVNDPEPFTYQHDVRPVQGKENHYTIMDNGNFHEPKYSRAVEYKLDTSAMTAEKVWQYRHSPDRFAHWMGSVQRLSNGNTLIGWASNNLPKVTEVTPDGEVVYEGDYTTTETSYRSHRFNWNGCARRPFLLVESYNDRITLLFNQFGDTTVQKYYVYADTTKHPSTLIDSTSNPYIHLVNLKNHVYYYFRVTSIDSAGQESEFSNEVKTFVRLNDPMDNLVINGNFALKDRFWSFFQENEDMAIWNKNSNGECQVQVYDEQAEPEDIILYQSDITLVNDRTYRLNFEASTLQERPFDVKLMDPYTKLDYSKIGGVKLSPQRKRYDFEFTMKEPTDFNAQLAFFFGHSPGKVILDNVSLFEIETPAQTVQQKNNINHYQLYQNYPNPFNDQTVIRYVLANSSSVELTMHNVVGQVIHSVRYKNQQAGEHHYSFDASSLSSGIYLCHMHAQAHDGSSDFQKTVKLICIK